ncbi:MAG: hydantoinase B/oxoprolinase family protein [Burkholderiaceae bacterium]
MKRTATRVDAVELAVLQRRLKSVTEEMGLALLRTTRSPILSEARDFVTGLYDARGRMLEQTEYIPVLAFALQPACEHVIRYFGDDVHDGDVILHNDVFSGGNQNNDVAVFKPVFHRGKLVAWAACKGHQADIGGAVRGGYNPNAREVWQEALRIPPLKIVERGKLRRDVWDMVFANVRLSVVAEDIKAQIGGCRVGERGYLALVERFGAQRLPLLLEALFDRTARMLRAEVAAIPDGRYTAQSIVFDDGVDAGARMTIALAVEVHGERLTIDLTGTSPQTPGFVNAPASTTKSALLLSLLMLVSPDMPHNDGLTRSIEIVNPEGSFLHARFPAATTFGNSLTGPISDALFRALAPALPDRVCAGWNRFLGMAIAGHDPRHDRPYADILFLSLKGGSGAVKGADGYDHIGLINCAGGILAQDYEMFEIHDPHLLRRHEYWCDSAGAGRWRGGLGVETEFEVRGERVGGVVFGDGVDEGARAFGLFGGGSGARNELTLTAPDGSVRRPASKQIVDGIAPGTVLFQRAGGGGGWGDPAERDPALVLADVRAGVVSVEAARRDYRVWIDAERMALDDLRTAALRARKDSPA